MSLQHPKHGHGRPFLVSGSHAEPGERTCAVCGALASDTVAFAVSGQALEKDLCQGHLAELLHGARPTPR
jgi:hypothetical protein